MGELLNIPRPWLPDGILVEPLVETSMAKALEARILRTLSIAERWGYGLRSSDLARMLYGGSVEVHEVRAAAAVMPQVSEIDGYFVVQGRSDLAEKSAARSASNSKLRDRYSEIAEAFAVDLLRHAPFIRSLCLSGSLASDGVGLGDDVDFNIATEPGTKYLVYLVGLGLGVRYSLRYGHQLYGPGLRPRLRKVTCINVVWEDDLSRPFVRQDEFLAFELLRTVVLAGSKHWSGILRDNEWLGNHFPQLLEMPLVDRVPRPPPSTLGTVLLGIVRRPWSRQLANVIARWATHVPYSIVQFVKRRNLAEAQRQKFLRLAKFPYEFFQD